MPLSIPDFALNLTPTGRPDAVTDLVVGAIVTLSVMVAPTFPVALGGAESARAVIVVVLAGIAVVGGTVASGGLDVDVPEETVVVVSGVAGDEVGVDGVSGAGAVVAGGSLDGGTVDEVESARVVKLRALLCLATDGQSQHATSLK